MKKSTNNVTTTSRFLAKEANKHVFGPINNSHAFLLAVNLTFYTVYIYKNETVIL
jgi:hypothetical protein